MFGYVTIAPGALTPERRARYRACYCGLCRALRTRYGQLGRLTLSYDCTLLRLMLGSLYEPEETEARERCLPHMLKPHVYAASELDAYCADMNVALAYHKCRDNWADERGLEALAALKLLEGPYGRIKALYPERVGAMEKCLTQITALEKAEVRGPDVYVNLTGELLGTLYRYREDEWADTMEAVGRGLGRFIYLMDAYEDLPRDRLRKRFNPLKLLAERPDYEEFMRTSLTMLIAECTEAFETLPLVRDIDLMRNVLYDGCWTRYQQIKAKREKREGRAKSAALPRGKDHKEDGA